MKKQKVFLLLLVLLVMISLLGCCSEDRDGNRVWDCDEGKPKATKKPRSSATPTPEVVCEVTGWFEVTCWETGP